MNVFVNAAIAGTAVNSKAAAGTDPIFAAIEAHKAAYTALDACLSRKNEVEERFMDAVAGIADPKERYGQLKAMQAASSEWTAFEEQTAELHEAEEDATIGMIDARPTTLAGASALLRYVVDQERRGNQWPTGLHDDEADFDNEDWVTFLHRNIAEVIEAAA